VDCKGHDDGPFCIHRSCRESGICQMRRYDASCKR
jgi:hypothetical protein